MFVMYNGLFIVIDTILYVFLNSEEYHHLLMHDNNTYTKILVLCQSAFILCRINKFACRNSIHNVRRKFRGVAPEFRHVQER